MDRLREEPVEYKIVSSAKKCALQFRVAEMILFKYIVNKRGPRMDPCGTPILTLRGLDLDPLETTV